MGQNFQKLTIVHRAATVAVVYSSYDDESSTCQRSLLSGLSPRLLLQRQSTALRRRAAAAAVAIARGIVRTSQNIEVSERKFLLFFHTICLCLFASFLALLFIQRTSNVPPFVSSTNVQASECLRREIGHIQFFQTCNSFFLCFFPLLYTSMYTFSRYGGRRISRAFSKL